MKKVTLFVVLFACKAILPAQSPSDATPVIQALNERIAATTQGYFTIDARFKFADGEDTIAHKGVCYFFRKWKNADSLAQFVVVQNDKPAYAFDGENFYNVIESLKKIRVTNVNAVGGAQKVMRGNVMISNLIFKNLLYDGRPAFRVNYFDTIEISAKRAGNLSVLRLTLRDTSIEPALGNVANNKIISTYHYDIGLPEFYLASMSGEVWLFDGWQYERKDFSPVVSLPATATLQDYFNPEKLSSEYTFEQYDPTAPVKRDVELIAVGATLPDFTLSNLSGESFLASAHNDGLLLLDFWYKGCFPCQLAMPAIEHLHRQYESKGLQVLGINPFDKNTEQLNDWLKSRNITYPTLLDPDKQLPKALGLTAYPLLLIADARTKKVIYVHEGYSESLEADLEPVIREHLK